MSRAWEILQDSTGRGVEQHEGHLVGVRNYGGERLAIECQTCHRSLFEWQREKERPIPVQPVPALPTPLPSRQG